MNDFERQLGNQPWREVPPAWREEILRQAPRAKDPASIWKELLWPSPAIWGAMAAVWLVFVTVDPMVSGGRATRGDGQMMKTSSEASNQIQPTFHLTSTDNPLIASLR